MTETMIDIYKKLEDIKDIPSMPEIANRLLELIYAQDVEINHITDLIKADPAMTVRILHVANSAYYSFKKNISNIKNAIVLLGLREIRNLILSITIFRMFEGNEYIERKQSFFKHSFYTANVSSLLSKSFDFYFSGEEFTGGLLHDIGRMIIDQYFIDESSEIDSLMAERNIPLLEAEQQILNVSHMQIGAWLGEKWKIPDKIIDVIRYHHHPEKSIYDKNLVFIVYLANLYTNFRLNNLTADEPIEKLVLEIDEKFLEKYGKETILNSLKKVDEELENVDKMFGSFY